MKAIAKFIFVVFGIYYSFFWPREGAVSVYLFDILDITPVAILVIFHLGIISLYPKNLYPIGVAIACLIAVASVLIGGAVLDGALKILEILGVEMEPLDYDLVLFQKLLNILSIIPFYFVILITIPYDRLLSWLTSSKRFGRIRKFAVLAVRIVEHIIFVVAPRILFYLREERVLVKVQSGEIRKRLLGIMTAVVVEAIVSSLELLPHWIDELSTYREPAV